MNNFKIGQKVKCIKKDAGQAIQIGKIYTISFIFDSDRIELKELKHITHSYLMSKFEPIAKVGQQLQFDFMPL